MRTRTFPQLISALALSLALAALLAGCGGQSASTEGATSPGALTDAYGVGVITPPRSPKILVNAAQTSAEYFENVRSAEELRTLADAAR